MSEDFGRSIRAVLQEVGIRPDDRGYRGELARLFDGRPGIRRRYFRRSGVDVDGFAEIVWSRGLTPARLDCREMLDVLEIVLAPAPAAKERQGRIARGTIDAAEQHARSNRLRKFVCDACEQIARGTRNSSLICGLCYEMSGEIHLMRRTDPLPEEILRSAV